MCCIRHLNMYNLNMYIFCSLILFPVKLLGLCYFIQSWNLIIIPEYRFDNMVKASVSFYASSLYKLCQVKANHFTVSRGPLDSQSLERSATGDALFLLFCICIFHCCYHYP